MNKRACFADQRNKKKFVGNIYVVREGWRKAGKEREEYRKKLV
jgi:hypothetical protein